MRGGGFGVSANEYSCTHGAQINFGDLTPYLTYGCVGDHILQDFYSLDVTRFRTYTIFASHTSDRKIANTESVAGYF
jgi:hypothetical protein